MTHLFPVSENVAKLKGSSPLLAGQAAAEMRASGIDVIDLSVGEPDFDTPEFIKQYAWEGLEKGLPNSPGTAGLAEFRSAIVEFYASRFGAELKSAEIAAACGGKQALFNAACTVLNPGDDVLIPKPYWVTFPEIVTFCRANSVFIETDPTDFILTADQVLAAITLKSKLLIINSTNNPIGHVLLPKQFLRFHSGVP